MCLILSVHGWFVGLVAGARLTFLAYIDPNTGGMIFQLLAVIMASLTGILLFFSRQIRVAIAQFKRRLGISSVDGRETATDETGDQDTD